MAVILNDLDLPPIEPPEPLPRRQHYNYEVLVEAYDRSGKDYCQLERELAIMVGKREGLTDWSIRRVVMGEVDPKVSTLKRVCLVLGVDIMEVLR